jgi:arylsulfatase A
VSANNNKIGDMKTPHLDKLISQGMNFTDAHSGSAVCTPTRYGLLTGRYCWRTKLKSQVLWEWGAPLIEKDRLTVADMVRAHGYSTGMVGKWHLGMDWYDSDGKIVNGDLQITDSFFRNDAVAERVRAVETRIDFTKSITGGPTDHGFDYFFGVDVPNFPPYVWIENDTPQGVPSTPKPKVMFGHPGPMISGWKLEDILPGLARKAGEWIAEQSTTDQPFFLYLSLTSPHTPIAPSKAFQGKSGISAYADFVLETDWVVGHIMDELDRAGVAGNTLLVFSADNGTSGKANFKQLESHGVDLHNHFKGHKTMIHEGGHRVPFVARWPGKITPSSTCSQTICLNDFMATTADILDFKLPDNAAEDSTSILPLLCGEKTSLPNRPGVVNHDYGGGFAIRKGKWKLVGTSKLFDLDADPKETKNVAGQYPEIVMELSATLKKYKESGRSRVINNAE